MNEKFSIKLPAPNKQFQKHCGHLGSNIITHGDGIADVHDDGSVVARFDLERVALESAGRIRRVGWRLRLTLGSGIFALFASLADQILAIVGELLNRLAGRLGRRAWSIHH